MNEKDNNTHIRRLIKINAFDNKILVIKYVSSDNQE